MKNSLRWAGIILPSILLISLGATAWGQGRMTTKVSGSAMLVDKIKGGEIDWGNEMFVAYGEGIMPSPSKEPNRAKAYLKAKGYARMQAVANLLMVLEGTRISYEATGKDYMTDDERIRQQIEGTVRGVEVLEDSTRDFEGNTLVSVKVGTRMYGKGNPGTILLERDIRQEQRSSSARPEPVKVVVRKAAVAPSAPTKEGPYSSLILDTRGLDISRAMSPKIRRQDGSEVWGTVHVDPDYAVETGIVSYVRSMEDARRNRRCGENPLIIKAIGRGDHAANCDAVVSSEDARLILDENNQTKFLDQCKVILIVDPNN